MAVQSEGEKTTCRAVTKADFAAIAALLSKAFVGRGVNYFAKGLQRMADRQAGLAEQRFGFLLETGGRVVGVLLQIFSDRPDFPGGRCNFASWYVEPEFRAQAMRLLNIASKDRAVTYINVTPAAHTWPILEVLRYRKFCSGMFLAFPFLARQRSGVQLSFLSDGTQGLAPHEIRDLTFAEAQGCTVFVARKGENVMPFAFAPFFVRKGRVPLPLAQMVYCRATEDFVASAPALGRALLKQGRVGVIMDADGKVAGLPGFFTSKRGRKYVLGSGPAKMNDLLDSEFVVFGI